MCVKESVADGLLAGREQLPYLQRNLSRAMAAKSEEELLAGYSLNPKPQTRNTTP